MAASAWHIQSTERRESETAKRKAEQRDLETQARQLTMWSVAARSSNTGPLNDKLYRWVYSIYVTNSSSANFTDVLLEVSWEPTADIEKYPNKSDFHFPVLGPRGVDDKPLASIDAITPRDRSGKDPQPEVQIAMRFTDINGVRWVKHGEQLDEQQVEATQSPTPDEQRKARRWKIIECMQSRGPR